MALKSVSRAGIRRPKAQKQTEAGVSNAAPDESEDENGGQSAPAVPEPAPQEDQAEAPDAKAPAADDEPLDDDFKVATIDTPVPIFDAEHMRGQLGDWLLTELKAARMMKPWPQLKEHEQKRLVERAYDKAGEIIEAMATGMAQRGFSSIDATFDSGAFKGEELVIKLKARRTATNLAACTEKGRVAQIVFCDPAAFAGAMLQRAKPDQPALIAEPETGAPEGDLDGAPDPDEEFDEETGEILDDDPEPPTPAAEPPADPAPALAL